MFADEIRRAIDAADRIALPQVTALLWRAYGDGQVTEAEAEALSGLIEARTDVSANSVRLASREPAAHQDRQNSPRRPGVGSRPRTDASMERRRRWAAAGRLPPQVALRFTQAEVAALAVVTMEAVKRGDCRLCLDHIAAIAGVSRSTVRAALRQARMLGLLTIEERRSSTWRNLPNVVRIVSAEWKAWMRLARQSAEPRGGVKSARPTNTGSPEKGRQRPAEPSQGCRRAAGDPIASRAARIVVPGRTGRAMR